MSEPDRPNSEDEKAVPMPASGAASPVLSASSMEEASPAPGSSAWMVSLIEPIVLSRPQKVPSRPRKTSRPTR